MSANGVHWHVSRWRPLARQPIVFTGMSANGVYWHVSRWRPLACQPMVSTGMSPNRKEGSSSSGAHAKAGAEFASWHPRAALLALARNANTARLWAGRQRKRAVRVPRSAAPSAGSVQTVLTGGLSRVVTRRGFCAATWYVSQPAPGRQRQHTQRFRGLRARVL